MKKPNVLVVTIEELRADFLGHRRFQVGQTPFLDALAASCATFDRHFTVHGKCVPSRCAFYSGRYPHVDGHRTLGITLQDGEINLAQILKRAGYHTVLAGINHVVDHDAVDRSFDEFWTEGADGKRPLRVNQYAENDTAYDRRGGNRHADNYILGKLRIDPSQRMESILTQRARSFFADRARTEDSAPFFLNLNYQFTHPPYGVMEPYYSRFMNAKLPALSDQPGEGKPEFVYQLHDIYQKPEPLTPEDRHELLAIYLGMLNFVDEMIQSLLSGLEEAGLAEQTIVVITADHGDFVGEYGLLEKWDTLFSDCLLNVPLLIRYPGFVRPGSYQHLTENVDLLPTLLDLLKIEHPYGIQGRSLQPLLLGCEYEPKEYVFAEGGHEPDLLEIRIPPETQNPAVVGYKKKASLRELNPRSLYKAKMIRTDTHKFIYRTTGDHELYDLLADPGELHNVYGAAEHRDLVHQLQAVLLDHMIHTEQNLPHDPRPIA